MIDVGMSGKDLNLEAIQDCEALIGTTWADANGLWRRIVGIEDLRPSRSFPGQFVGTIIWVRPQWEVDAQPVRQWFPYFLRRLRGSTCVSVPNKEVSP